MPLIFLHPEMLLAAAAAAAPFLLHLLHKRRARRDLLPTMRFLVSGPAANRRRMRLKNLLILLLRVLALLLLVATLARPAWIGDFFSRKGTAPVNAVIVVDNSASMAYQRAGATRLDRAKELAGQVLEACRPPAAWRSSSPAPGRAGSRSTWTSPSSPPSSPTRSTRST